jgi:hypothetical protein
MTISDFHRITRDFLAISLVDDSDSERRLLEVWMRQYDRQVEACAAHD